MADGRVGPRPTLYSNVSDCVNADRRRLLRVLGRGAAGAGILGLATATRDEFIPSAYGTEVRRYYPRFEIGPLSDLEAGPLSFTYPDDASPCVAVALDRPAEHGVGADRNVVAFSQICPHMGCPIDRVDASTASLGPCRCHFSSFDLASGGAQIQGQSTEDLPQVLLEEQDGKLVAVGIRGLLYGRFENVR